MIDNLNPLHESQSRFKDQLTKGKVISFDEMQLKSDSEFDLYHEKLFNWYNSIVFFDFLPDFPPKLEEIYIHSPTQIVYKVGNYKLDFDTDITSDDLQRSYEILALKNNQSWNFKNPFISFNSELNGHKVRVSLAHFSTSPEKNSKIFIRLLNKIPYELSSYVGETELELINSFIQNKKNVIVAGATGSGKTTFLNSLLKEVPEDEHIVILEDTYELVSPSSKTTRMISETNDIAKSLNAYLSYVLRMSPDRIILGEIRSKEVESIILALNTGHNGLLSTVHANSAKDALSRLALLFKIYSNKDLSYELILKLICSNIDYVIYIENKKVKEVIEVFGSEKDNIYFDQVL
jgi:type IV secretory pathway ATPase VirB11/archaellum biosynthesis ATPase